MNLFGLEGSGFLIAICLTLFLSGMIVFYVRQKFNETDHKIQHMLGIVQQINSNQMPKPQGPRLSETGITGFGAPVGGVVGGGNMNGTTTASPNVQEFSQNEIDMNLLTNMPPIPEEREGQKISISESSEISSTTDEDVDDDVDEDDVDEDVDDDDDDNDDDDEKENGDSNDKIINIQEEVNDNSVEVLNEEELISETKIIDDLPSGNKVINIESMDDIELDDFTGLALEENTTTDSDDNEIKIEGDSLDSMLLGMIDTIGKKNELKENDIHVVEVNNLNESQKLNDLKVGELRQMIKDRGMKVQNISKLKKNECLELLAE